MEEQEVDCTFYDNLNSNEVDYITIEPMGWNKKKKLPKEPIHVQEDEAPQNVVSEVDPILISIRASHSPNMGNPVTLARKQQWKNTCQPLAK